MKLTREQESVLTAAYAEYLGSLRYSPAVGSENESIADSLVALDLLSCKGRMGFLGWRGKVYEITLTGRLWVKQNWEITT